MRIDQIEITNFKCFEHKTIQFSPCFNVLSGDNGTGKTAVLDALAVGMGALLLGFNGAERRHIKPHEMRHVGYYMGQNLKVEPQPPTKLHYLGELNHSGTIRWERRLMTKNSPTATKTWGENSMRDLTKELQKRVQAGDNTVILPLLSYYGTCHLCLQLPENPGDFITPDSRLAIYRDCLNPVSYKDYYRLLETAKNASPVEKERLKNRLDKLAAPFSDNMAYHAFLELQREVAGLGGGNANAAS